MKKKEKKRFFSCYFQKLKGVFTVAEMQSLFTRWKMLIDDLSTFQCLLVLEDWKSIDYVLVKAHCQV